MKKNKCQAYLPGTGLLSIFLGVSYYFGSMLVPNSPATISDLIVFQSLFVSVLTFFIMNLAAKYFFSAATICEREAGFRFFFAKHAFVLSFIFLLLVWFPHLIYQYPAVINNDVYCQVQAVLSNSRLQGHHPIIHTELLRLFLNIGRLLGKYDTGMLIMAIVQNIVVGLIFSYVVDFLVRLKVSGGVVGITLLFFGFSFFTAGNINNLTKDTLYSAFSLLLFTLYAEYLLDREGFFVSKKRTVLLVLSSVLVFLFRKNGKFILLPLLLILLILELKGNEEKKKYRIAVIITAILLPFLSQFTINAIVRPTGASIREALSLPFQQTALLAREAPELVTAEEREVINKILPYDELPKLYVSWVSDPVKKRFNDNATTRELLDYLKVWFKQFFRAPLIYIAATYSQNVYLFYTGYYDYTNELILEDNGGRSAPLTDHDYEFIAPKWKKDRIEEYRELWRKTFESPLFGWINNISTYTILLLLMLLLVIRNRDGVTFLFSIPLILCVLIVIAAPAIRNNSRYIYPLIWSWPVWTSFYRVRQRNLENAIK